MSLNVTFNGSMFIIPETGEVGWGGNTTSYLVAIAAGALQKTGGSFLLSSEIDFGAAFGLKSLYYKSRSSNIAVAGILRLNNNSDSINFRNFANSADLPLTVDTSDRLLYNGVPVLTGTAPGAYVSAITGTANQVIASSPTGSVTLSLPQSIDTSANVQFGTLGLGSAITASSILSLSSISLGFLPPRMTTTQRDAIVSPATGLFIYNTITGVYNYYNGSAWTAIAAGGTINPGLQYQIPYYATNGSTLSALPLITASRALQSDTNGLPIASTVTATELGYLSGVTSSVQTQLNNLQELVSVKIYGAVGNGIADDTAAINTALASGNNLFFPPGTYLTTGNHTITTQYISGFGKNYVTLKRSSGTNPILTMTGRGKITGMTLDGNNLGGAALVLNGSTYGILEELNMKNVAGTSYAMQTLGTCEWLAAQDLEFNNNYGHLKLNEIYYSSFFRTKMFNNTTDFCIRFETNGITDIKFYDTYMEGGLGVYMTNFGIRDIVFDGLRARINSLPAAWWQSTYSPGSETANITLAHASIFKNVASTTIPIFDVSTYQLYTSDIHIYDSSSAAGWSVIRDRGTFDFRMQDWEIESTNAWNLFDAASDGGSFTRADHVSYTQGVVGTAVWSSQVTPGGVGPSSYVSVRGSNLNHSIRNTHLKGGYIFENLSGNLDLTNSTAPVWIWNVQGTVTDPNNVAIISATGRLHNVDGSAVAPTYSWSTSPTTGMWLNTPDRIAFSIAGTRVADILSTSFGTSLPFSTSAASPSALEATASFSGGIVGTHVENTSNTSNSDANFTARVDGTSAGDPYFLSQIVSGSSWAWGADNSDSDKWKLCLATDIRSGDTLVVDTSGNLTITKTSNQLTFGVTNTVTISATAPAASRTWTIPDLTTNPTFAALEGTQTFSGAKTFSANLTISKSVPQLLISDTGTAQAFMRANTNSAANSAYFGQERAAGGGIFTNSTAYATVMGTLENNAVELHANDTLVLSAKAAGVAIRGTNTSDSASTGFIGEEIESKITANTNVGTSAQYSDLTSITLTAGDWDISAAVVYQRHGATFSSTDLELGISTTSGNSSAGLSSGYNYLYFQDVVPTTFTFLPIAIPTIRVTISTTTTYYLKGYVSVYTVATPQFNGSIVARRRR